MSIRIREADCPWSNPEIRMSLVGQCPLPRLRIASAFKPWEPPLAATAIGEALSSPIPPHRRKKNPMSYA